ncbi:MAG: phosphoglycolate phosphatase [Pseudomonadota bacterium]
MDQPRFPRPDALVFDLDGTLVDSAPDLAAALNRLLAEHDRPPLAEAAIRAMIGDGVARLVERGLAASGGPAGDPVDLGRRFEAIYEVGIAIRTRPFPGVVATLERLATSGIAMGVCTNKPIAAARRLLEALELPRYFAAIAGGDAPPRKPDPRHLLGLLERLGAAPDSAIMVGDSMNDVATARAARVKVIAVAFGYTAIPPAALGADALIERFADLPALIGLGPITRRPG